MRTETIRRIYDGVVISLRIDRVTFADGGVAEREVVEHPGAVAIVAYDDLHVHMVRQPREAIEVEGMLEVPAGKLDVPGEPRLECAKRELAEEVGLEAASWDVMHQIYPSPGFSRELVTIFEARELRPVAEHRPIPDERIEVVPWPLLDLDSAIEACEDAKSLIGLLILRRRLHQQEVPDRVPA